MPHRRRKHHLPEEVFVNETHVVSITTCTADRAPWLSRPDLAEIAKSEVVQLHQRHPVFGYCLMPDHVHLILCNAGASPGRIVNLFKGRTSRRVRRIEPEMSVWQSGYWDHVVRRHEGLLRVLEYTLMNPVRAGLVEHWWEHPWLGSPMLGPIGPELFTTSSTEDGLWSELLELEDQR